MWPLAIRAQQAAPIIGFLGSGSAEAYADRLSAIRAGLQDTGYVEGQNLKIEYRWAHGRYDQLPELAADLVRRQVDVIIASGSRPAALAAKAATSAIPIVLGTGGDPVREGLVASFSRPGGNATGISVLTETLGAKRLEVIRDLLPKVDVIALLADSSSDSGREQIRDTQEAARLLGQRLHIQNASHEGGFEPAFAALVQMRVGALVVTAEPFFNARRAEIVALAARHAIPAIYPRREFVAAGGLMSYGPNLTEVYRQQGVYAGRILKGAKPADLPIFRPTKFELVINLNTTRALGLEVPPRLLARADEAIE
jgi:putative ABC transport system substrate-binding protein